MVFASRLQQRASLQGALSNLQADYDALAIRCDEEAEDAANAKARYAKLEGEFMALKGKFDGELAAKADEVEETR